MVKLTKRIAMLLTASVLAFTPAVETIAAPVQAVEINAKKEMALSATDLELKAGETAKLKVTGTKKKVKWSSSDTNIAKVNKKGKVQAVADGAATITAKVGKTELTCSVNVWSQEFVIDTSKIRNNQFCIWYYGELDKEAQYYLNGEQLKGEIWIDEDDDNAQNINFNERLTEGTYTFEIKKAGYKTFSYSFTMEAKPEIEGIFAEDPRVQEGTLYALLNSAVEQAYPGFEVDGASVTPTNSFVNGDGYFVVWIDATSFSKGTHKVTVSAEGFDAETREFTIE